MENSRILVIDDDPGFAGFVVAVAKECNFEAVAATSPEEFLARLDGWNPDAIILDLHMPGVDGVELLRELGNRNVRAKVALASGFDARVVDTARRLGIAAGLDIIAALTKPVRAKALREVLTRVRSESEPITAATLARAIEDNELVLHYQPRLDIGLGCITGAEALVRWRHPSKGLLPPGAFLAVAESDPVIDRLTNWVVDAALGQAAAWRRAGLQLALSINLSARNLGDLELPDRLAQRCAAYGVPSDSLVFELTETATMEDANRIMDVLTRIRLKGFGLSIDDFGTGFSSLVQLRRLPFNEIKIDKSFVADMLQSKDSAAIVKTIIDMGHNLGLEPVAEGVESEKAARVLASLGCSVLQGYWIAPALPAGDFRSFLAGYRPPADLSRLHPGGEAASSLRLVPRAQ